MADGNDLSDAERTRLRERRDRLMKLMNAGQDDDGEALDDDDRADFAREWQRLDDLLNRR